MANQIQRWIRDNAKKLAEESRLALLVDHYQTRSLSLFGIVLRISTDCNRAPLYIMLELKTVDNKKIEYTKELLIELLQVSSLV